MAVDTFNRANQTGLGTSSEGWSWSNPGGAGTGIDIVSNQAQGTISTGGERWRADIDVGSPDMFTAVTVNQVQTAEANFHLFARFDPAAQTAYQVVFKNSATNTFILSKLVAGLGSSLANINTAVPTPPFRLKIEVSGSATTTVRVLVDDVEVLSAVDNSSPITGNERGGMGVSGDHVTTPVIVDNFEAETLEAAAGGGGSDFPVLRRRRRF